MWLEVEMDVEEKIRGRELKLGDGGFEEEDYLAVQMSGLFI